MIGSFEDIGKDIISNISKLPGDIAGSALESVVGGTGPKPPTPASQPVPEGVSKGPQDAWDVIDQSSGKSAKQAIARSALQALTNRQKKKEPTVWEKIQQEMEQKKQQQNQQKQADSQQLKMPTSKRSAGDLYGVQAKKTAAENRSKRQD